VVVDDSSKDGTQEATRKLNNQYGNIKLIVRKKKEGMGTAIRHGLNQGKGKFLISMDVDSLDAKDIIRFMDKLKQGVDLVVGSRYKKGGFYEKKRFRTVIKNTISTYGNKFLRVLFQTRITDFSLNFRGFKANAWRSIKTKEKGNAFMMETIVKASQKHLKIVELPVIFHDRVYGESKFRPIKQSVRVLWKAILLKVGK